LFSPYAKGTYFAPQTIFTAQRNQGPPQAFARPLERKFGAKVAHGNPCGYFCDDPELMTEISMEEKFQQNVPLPAIFSLSVGDISPPRSGCF